MIRKNKFENFFKKTFFLTVARILVSLFIIFLSLINFLKLIFRKIKKFGHRFPENYNFGNFGVSKRKLKFLNFSLTFALNSQSRRVSEILYKISEKRNSLNFRHFKQIHHPRQFSPCRSRRNGGIRRYARNFASTTSCSTTLAEVQLYSDKTVITYHWLQVYSQTSTTLRFSYHRTTA